MKNVEVVCAVIIKDNKLFCCQRGSGRALEDLWEFPGGKIEVGETKEAAIVREIKEELNTDIKAIKYLCTSEHTYPDMPPYKGFHIIMHAILCEVVKGNLTLSEHKSSKWLSKSELNSVAWADADKPIVREVAKLLPRRIILSRKGLDSSFFDMPSPILPDETLLSIPIPLEDNVEYSSLSYDGKKYTDIIKELRTGCKKQFKFEKCHLDPDLRKEVISRPDDWCPAFGQADQALSHLNNHGVCEGDIFLFFGRFKQTEYRNGVLRFARGAQDLHVIFGYLEVGEKLETYEDMQKAYWHPHALEKKDLNTIYLASEKLLDTNLPGSGVFKFDDDLVLTKKGMSRSKWELPKCLFGKEISYHTSDSYKEDFFQSVAKGQEFVIEADDEILEWVKSLTKHI